VEGGVAEDGLEVFGYLVGAVRLTRYERVGRQGTYFAHLVVAFDERIDGFDS